MNIYNLDQELKFINQIGYTLNTDEKIKLQLGLQQINSQKQYDEVKFWGRIEGSKKDYYIALAIQYKDKYEFPLKHFFYSSSDFQFYLLPDLLLEYHDKVNTSTSQLIGDPKHILVQVNTTGDPDAEPVDQDKENEKKPENVQVDSDDEDQVKVVPRNFTELDRLAYIVRAIENDCQIVPVGAIKLTCDHEIRYNDSFQGIDRIRMSSFQHFRAPQSDQKKQLMKQDDALFCFDFLDGIEGDLPKGCWSLQKNNKIITVRSLKWLGYLGYHQLNSNVFGGCYFGNGLQNSDLPFYLNQH